MTHRESNVFFLLAVSAFAQQTDTPQTASVPTPVDTDAPGSTEYGGPAILSRGATSSLRAPTQNIRFRPFLTLTAAYDTGITPLIVGRTGALTDESSFGGDAEAGIYGFHRGKSSTIGLDYRGSYHHYAKNSFYNGTEQALSFIYSKQATRRLYFTLRNSAGLFNRNFDINGGAQLIDPNFSNLPTNELFDGRTIYLSTAADLTYRKSARLSFNFGGEGFLVRRHSSSLYGVTGYRARGDVAYRTSRYATSGIAYDFSHFEYTKGFGGSDIHTVQFVQSFRIGRSWELAMRAGGSRVETLGLTQVVIDPAIAAIIGRNVGVEAIYRINWVPSANAALTRSFHHAGLSFTYNSGVTPGNGVLLTSREQSVVAGFTYTGVRKTNIGFDSGYSSYSSLAQDIGKYTGYRGGGGLTYNLTRVVHLVSRYDYRHYDVGQSSFKRNTYRASIGLGFSPGDVPLSLW